MLFLEYPATQEKGVNGEVDFDLEVQTHPSCIRKISRWFCGARSYVELSASRFDQEGDMLRHRAQGTMLSWVHSMCAPSSKRHSRPSKEMWMNEYDDRMTTHTSIRWNGCRACVRQTQDSQKTGKPKQLRHRYWCKPGWNPREHSLHLSNGLIAYWSPSNATSSSR